MSFWQKIKAGLVRFMEGRNGPDQLSRFTLWTGLVLYVLSMFAQLGILSLLGFALYAWTLFRMFSRNRVRRFAENQKYLALSGTVRRETTQFIRRARNAGQVKYFRCPQCRARLKLPRKVGSVSVTCGKCGHQFDAKA